MTGFSCLDSLLLAREVIGQGEPLQGPGLRGGAGRRRWEAEMRAGVQGSLPEEHFGAISSTPGTVPGT